MAALWTATGAELLRLLAAQPADPSTDLRLATRLREQYPAGLVAQALLQHELRLRARAKFSRAMDMFFTRHGLEQASAEVVARYRSARFSGAGPVTDLCCGIGGDLIALAAGDRVVGVDLDPVHLRMAAANAAVYGVGSRVTTVCADVRDVSLAGAGAVFIDPARRAGARRLRPGDSEPPLGWCLSLATRVARVGIKAAPGLPHEAVPDGWELEFIAVGRDLKEAAAWSPALATAARRATILPGGHTLTAADGDPVDVRPPGAFLLDPNPAVTRARAVADLARAAGAWKIDEQIAFLATDQEIHTPFGRTLRVIDSAPWRQKELPARLRALGAGAVDIRRRGLAGDVQQLHRRLKLTGSRRLTLVMTRVSGQPWGLVCEDVPAPEAGQPGQGAGSPPERGTDPRPERG